MSNVVLALWNRGAKLFRAYGRRSARGVKQARKSLKTVTTEVHRGTSRARGSVLRAYASGAKSARAWERWRHRTWAAAALELSVRRELAAAARGRAPIVVGPWLSEVGYEALYWVPFVRWFAEHYRVAPERLVVVSRGGVGGWYADITGRYVELLELFSPEEIAHAHERRRLGGDQKQLRRGELDEEAIDRVRERLGTPVHVCHPSTMFRLLRQFWLGTESLQRVLDHTRHRRIAPPPGICPPLPERFVAVKFYTGRALPDTAEVRDTLRRLLTRIAEGRPLVVLEAGVELDEHRDYTFGDLPGVQTLDAWLTPQNNLAVQTEVIRRADLFVGTCGSLAWLAPLLGTPTLAVFADDHLLAPHLYAARQIYPMVQAASFTPVDIALPAPGAALTGWNR